ncbi:MAG: hypothetical protein IT514_03275 [Burkholderiales bacterium]|nr:hypothetical protein [Burkholderiales bacterium]
MKTSSFGALDFGRVAESLLTDEGVVQVASLEDLMAHELKVILQRRERKDYQDIASMVRSVAAWRLARELPRFER